MGVTQYPASSGSIAVNTFWDAKGDLAVGTGADTAAVLPVGSNGQVLTADSTQTTGTKWSTVAGAGTVTNTGTLTANSIPIGNGGADIKVVAGLLTDGVSKVTLGVAGSSVGAVAMNNATSGTITLQPVTGALGTVTVSLPAATDTLVGKATTDTLTNKTLTAPVLSGTVTGTYTLGGTPTFPSSVVTLTGSQTLTNKTLTSPIIGTISNTGTLTLPTSTDTLVGRATTDTLTNKTLTSPAITTPKITTSINDSAGNEVIKTPATASAVNEITVTNAATTGSPTISATGDDTNINLTLAGKGTGGVIISGSGAGQVVIAEGTPAGAASGYDVLSADSSGHRLQLSNNNGSFSNIVTAASTDTLTNKTLTAPVITSPLTSLSAALGTDDTYSGTTITGLNNSGGVTQWDAVYLNGSSQWVLADANGSGTYPARGLATATVATGNATTVVVHGTVRNDGWAWTPGGTLYLSTTAGSMTQTAPSASGDKVQAVGYALTATIIFVDFNSTYLTVT